MCYTHHGQFAHFHAKNPFRTLTVLYLYSYVLIYVLLGDFTKFIEFLLTSCEWVKSEVSTLVCLNIRARTHTQKKHTHTNKNTSETSLSVWYKYVLLYIILNLIIVHSADTFVRCQMLLIHSGNCLFWWAAEHRLWYWAAELRLWYCRYWAAGLRLWYCHNACTYIWETVGSSVLLCSLIFVHILFVIFSFLPPSFSWTIQHHEHHKNFYVRIYTVCCDAEG